MLMAAYLQTLQVYHHSTRYHEFAFWQLSCRCLTMEDCAYIGRTGPIISLYIILPWWRHQMETFSALLYICAGNSPVPGEFPTQRPVTRSFDVSFDLRPNKRVSKQWWGWWFETPSSQLWRHCNTYFSNSTMIIYFMSRVLVLLSY